MGTVLTLAEIAVITGLACYSYVLGVRRGRRRGISDIASLRSLVSHCWLHSNYRECGYQKMTTEERALFDEITGRNAA